MLMEKYLQSSLQSPSAEKHSCFLWCEFQNDASHLHKNDPSFLLWAWQTPSPAYTEEKQVLRFKIKHKIHEMRSKDDLILHSVHSIAAWLQSHLTASPGKKAKTCLLPTSTSELPTQWNISIYLEYLHTSPWFPHFTSDWAPIRPWETY